MPENKEIINNQNEQFGNQQTEKPVEVMRDLQKDREVFVPREVKSWMEKVEQEQEIPSDDSVLQPITTTTTPKITLSTDKKVFSEGFNKTIGDAGRWLSEFMFRLIKKNKGNVKFKEE